ncbi:hypothetical protein PEL8287_02845 [Roseovarius litorisediminis]|uniref:DUF5672 domain-containing protein n=1 Tax=Roseovarius litorisediminis TaxID=1312363 RepID=A0A1Y5T151_9RHOB|nr:hypothetical protein PEL8287_02845 [Roseovarius litorisediminis]
MDAPVPQSSQSRENNSCRIVVPVYRTLDAAELAIVTHNLKKLAAWPATLVGPNKARDVLEKLRGDLSRATGAQIAVLCYEDRFFADIEGYSALLMSRQFYGAFAGHSHILICQSDALVLSDRLDEWMAQGFSFVGAPIFKGYTVPIRPLQFEAALNGGLSLRHVQDAQNALHQLIVLRRSRAVRLLEKAGILTFANRLLGRTRIATIEKRLNEDVFWSCTVPSLLPEFRRPTPEIAAHFAFEACPADLYEQTGQELPFGGHAIERYDPEFWQAHLPDRLAARVAEMAQNRVAKGKV